MCLFIPTKIFVNINVFILAPETYKCAKSKVQQ